jgi:tRNA(Ile)-lysidine synthase
MIETVQATMERYRLFTAGQTVVVAVSGGPDSTVLLHVLTVLRERWKLNLVAAHLNHGFRDAESEGDADYVAELSERLGVPCRIAREDVPARRMRQHLSAQEAARQARHAFLRRVAEQAGAARIALGHTRDDRIETILLNLLRGTGLEGLSGMPPLQPPLVRPLYDISREETQAYCAQHHLHPRTDSSNAKMEYRRNRVRTELLPYLATYYNEKVGDAILRLSDLASADNALLEEWADEFRERITQLQTPTRIVLDAQALQELPLALQRRILRKAIVQVRGHLQDIGFQLLEQALTTLPSGKTQSMQLPADGLMTAVLRYEESRLEIVQVPAAVSPVPWEVILPIPGRVELPQSRIALEMQVFPSAAEAREEAAQYIAAQKSEMERMERDSEPLLLRLTEVTLPLKARSWRPGDRMRPCGLGGSKKIQDLFTNRKIPARERHWIPILVDSGGDGRIFAVLGVHRDEGTLSPNGNEAEAGEILMITQVMK